MFTTTIFIDMKTVNQEQKCILYFFFFFKQKTAYEIRKGDWSSDVCSSDLNTEGADGGPRPARRRHDRHRNRHSPAPESRRLLQTARSHHRRRRASIRREAQGATQAAQARDRRADAHRHADSAYA